MNKAKSILAGGALFLSMVGMASAKAWDIVVDSATKAGSITLPAGHYNVKIKNNEAVFHESGTDKTFSVPVKIGQANQKFDQTAVETRNENGGAVIQRIDLGGTTEQLDFTD